MLEKYSEIAQSEESKIAPKQTTINAILNFSKSIEVKKTKKSKATILINLN